MDSRTNARIVGKGHYLSKVNEGETNICGDDIVVQGVNLITKGQKPSLKHKHCLNNSTNHQNVFEAKLRMSDGYLIRW